MTQVKIYNGDLHFIFKECNDTVIVHKLDNGAEVDFFNGECVSLILPNFKQQIKYGHIDNIKLDNMELQDNDFLFTIIVNGQSVNGKVNLSSLDGKI